MEIVGKALIRSERPASRLVGAIRQSQAVTIEAWVRPAKTNQDGPARIVTLSRNANERNFTLGQDDDKFEVRLRTTKTSTNGMPALVSKPKRLAAEWTHMVYSLGRAGKARLYVNGQLNAEQSLGGELANWDEKLELGLANELSQDRPWLGTYRLVAIYKRDLSPNEVQQNFRAGREVVPPSVSELLSRRRGSSNTGGKAGRKPCGSPAGSSACQT